MKDSIHVIMFDFGGVLAEEGFHNGLLALAREQGLNTVSILDAAAKAAYESGFILGKGTAADFWTMLHQLTGMQGDEASLNKRIIEGFEIRPWMIERVRLLRKQGFVTGILSDQTDWLDRLLEQNLCLDIFDHVFNSFYLGKGKRDPSQFTDISRLLNRRPGTILFIDDNLDNLTRAEHAGWRTILYKDRQSFELELDRWCGGTTGSQKIN